MNWSGQKVFVTGGAGFLGSNLCHALAARGARVTALDGFLFGGGANPRNLDGAEVEFVRGDIRELDLRPLCEGAAVIFNLAAQTSHMGGQADPLADIAVNAVAQVRLIQAAREAAPDAIVVHASTRQFYGRVEKLPVDENQPVAPPDANGVSKFAGEQYWMLEHRVRNRPGRLPAADQLLWPAAAHPRREADVPGHLDPLRPGKPAVRGLGRCPASRPDLCRRCNQRVSGGGGTIRLPRRASSISAARRRRRCRNWRISSCVCPAAPAIIPRGSFPPTARVSTSVATTPTTARSATHRAGDRKPRWKRASGAPWNGTGPDWRITYDPAGKSRRRAIAR